VAPELGDKVGHRGAALAAGTVDAQAILVGLVENGVEGEGGLARLAVAEDQLALAAADGDEGVDDLQPGLERHGDGGAVHDGPGFAFDRTTLRRADWPEAVEGPPQGVHDAAEQRLAHRRVEHAARAPDLRAGPQSLAHVEQDDAHGVGIDVEDHAQAAAREAEKLLGADAGQPVDGCDALADGGQGAHFARLQVGAVGIERAVHGCDGVVQGAVQLGIPFQPGRLGVFGGHDSAFASSLADAASCRVLPRLEAAAAGGSGGVSKAAANSSSSDAR